MRRLNPDFPASLNLLKMCVGCESIGDLAAWQQQRLAAGQPLIHRTRNRPKRAAEILGGGSLYWIIRGRIRVRQRILAIETEVNVEGARSCLIGLDECLIETEPTPCRPMQGWRYLVAAEAPQDLGARSTDELPPALIRELAMLGLA